MRPRQPDLLLMPSEQRQLRLIRKLGDGGFGTVWLGEVTRANGLKRRVAVKYLKDLDSSEAALGRFKDEARLLSLIQHAGVVQVDSLVHLNGRWAVLMEYIEGVDLSDALSLRGPFEPRVALSIVSDLARVLRSAWEAPGSDGAPLCLIHRDLKPSNIRITVDGVVKLLDFGIARADFDTREAETSTSVLIGTAAYMAPERFDQRDGPEGDIYALGAVLYELLLAAPLGRTSANVARHEAHRAGALERLEARRPALDPALIALIGDLIDYDPSNRPSPAALEDRCDAIAEAVGGESLRRWADREVRPLMAELEARAGHGAPLEPGPASVFSLGANQPAPGKPARRPWRALALAGLVGLAGGAMALVASRAPPGPAPAVPVPSVEVEAPVDAIRWRWSACDGAEPLLICADGTEATAAATAGDPGAATTVPPAGGRRPAPSASSARPRPAAAATGRVSATVSGEGEVALLRVEDGSVHAPGAVPAGSYRVRFRVGERVVQPPFTLTVTEGAAISVRCDAVLFNCSWSGGAP